MPKVKNALLRHRIIDKAIRNKYKPYPTKDDLKEACEKALYGENVRGGVSISTIEKDLQNMREEHDAPVKYSKRHKGYFYEDPDFSLDEIPLDESDISAIRFAANTLQQFRNVAVFSQFGTAIDKILERVSISEQFEEAEVERYIQFESSSASRGSNHLSVFMGAITNKKVVQFEYIKYQDKEKSTRRIHPYLLKEYNNLWYIIGYSPLKEKVLTFGLDRIENPEQLDDEFTIKSDFDPTLYFKHSVGITNLDKPPVEINILATPTIGQHLSSKPIHPSQLVELKEEHAIIRLDVQVTQELIMEILSYGDKMEVQTPDWLRAEIAKRIASMKENYT